ncbi:nucleoside deaminase [Ruminococcus flavefaciens]|uniref:nucleoside deaminase n=1 Tax=Ruminococcus flavefaciens TaxID=1265 RepID=UPI0026F1984D|nr:nucleoside deaminase [Ruminococcus flavefaciens]MDD7516131.1 nucleoside deaminase [Ruminococcus flavefaciens]MDY5692214.1 nucleoside deaminase [Ruminococcus flavefaciens]
MNKFMKIAIDEAKNGINAGHGEMMAIHNACKTIGSFDLSGCELYTTAEPCPMCRGAILWANISKVYYGCNISDTDAIGFRDKDFYSNEYDISEELDRKECLEVFKEYKDIKMKKHY